MSGKTCVLGSFAAILLGVLACASPLRAQTLDSIAERQRAVESGLLPEVIVASDPDPGYGIYEGMRRDSVPGLSVAVINGGAVEWAMGYGAKRSGSSDSVVVSTLFQGASLSKPIAATAALQLVDDGRLTLDDNVNRWLRSWRVPENEYTARRPVTLRGLLSHTAGLTVHGFSGYSTGTDLPSPVDILEGRGKTDPVRLDTIPGTAFRYSGGGYMVAQVLMQDVTGDRFAPMMEREVFDPLGMYRSTYEQPLSEHLEQVAAHAHRDDGTPLKNRWEIEPALAAAGLWTTPTDIARFALGIRDAYKGTPGALLQQSTAREMLSEQKENWGLGPEVYGKGDSLRFSHRGSITGYRAFFVLYPETGDGVAVMTNSEAAGGLMFDVARAVATVYDWPTFQSETRTVVEVPAETLADYVGDYQLPSGAEITVTRDEDQLFVDVPGEDTVPLLAESKAVFFPKGEKARLAFKRDSTGRVTHFILRQENSKTKAVRQVP
ncbi:serine hydrolase [Salinibacter altiplanensis]|uniref:serine hydrolase n=1 Tax=Salinibacter altiplanensis TaxID=1803181 RepID=UPI000C9F311D|nr:serine hydrolase [Salinibacter altiplanensis]